MKSFLTTLNLLRRDYFGPVGAPAAEAAVVATVLAWGVPTVTTWVRGAPVIFSAKVVIGVTVAVVAVTELGFYFLGRDGETLAEREIERLGELGETLLDEKDEAALKAFAAVTGKTATEIRTFAKALVAAKKAHERQEEREGERKTG